jgi:hypothetical protein
LVGRASRRCGIGLGLVLALASLSFASPPNDNLADRIRLGGPFGKATGTNLLATKEPREADHAGNSGGRSVWWSWTPPVAGVATFYTDGSDFDTLLAIYTGTNILNLRAVASDDNGGEGPASNTFFSATAGREYLIAVDGYNADTGNIVLHWYTTPFCAGPIPPVSIFPADGTSVAGDRTILRWGSGQLFQQKIIYGKDDRLDAYQVSSQPILDLWDSTAAMVLRSDLKDNGDGTYTLPSATFGETERMCVGEPFRDQPNPARCSGFLVAPDLMATAGHCAGSPPDCASVAFVFGFRMLDATTPVLTFPKSQVYLCSGVVGTRMPDDLSDWAVVQLDRPVPDHKPLRIRRDGKIADGQRHFMIGHPEGLPGKFDGGAWVRDNSPATYFVSNLDAYGGNSGSAVFNADTHIVEGMLVAGDAQSLIQSGDCWLSNRCPDDGCLGEISTRSTEFAHLVPSNPDDVTYRVFFGECGTTSFQGETADRFWEVRGLEPGKTYCWYVVARGECGEESGPTLSFTSTQPLAPFRRGDPSADGLVDLSDAILIVFHLFSGDDLSCLKSADVDDGGQVDLSDAVYLLSYLFLEGPPPAEPFAACGADPLPDDLGCADFAPCQGAP